MRLCVTLIVPIVHAALIFLILSPSRNKTNGLKECRHDYGGKPTQYTNLIQSIVATTRANFM